MTNETAYKILEALVDEGMQVTVTVGPELPGLGSKEKPTPAFCHLWARSRSLDGYSKEEIMLVNKLCKEHDVDWTVRIKEGIVIR